MGNSHSLTFQKRKPPAQSTLDYISHQHQQEKKESPTDYSHFPSPNRHQLRVLEKTLAATKLGKCTRCLPISHARSCMCMCVCSSLSRQFPFSLWLPLVCRRMCILPTHSIAPSSFSSPGKLAEVWSSFDCQAAGNGWAQVNWFRGCKTKTTVLYGGIYYPIQPQAESSTPPLSVHSLFACWHSIPTTPTSPPYNFPVKSASFFSPVFVRQYIFIHFDGSVDVVGDLPPYKHATRVLELAATHNHQ